MLVCAFFPTISTAQSAGSIRTNTQNPQIRVDLIATLGADPAGPALSRLSSIAMDCDGLFYVSSTYEAGEIAIFDRSGAYMRSFGRLGEGPGEFSRHLVRVLTGPGDSIHVLDGIRHTVFEPRAASVVRLHMLPFRPLTTAFTDDGRLVAGYPLSASREMVHVLSAEGAVERSFVTSPHFDPGFRYSGILALSNAGGGRFWVSHLNRYELELWSPETGLIRRIARNVDWFPPWAGRSEEVDRRPRLGGLLAHDGILWIRIRVPDPEHRTPIEGQPVADVDMNKVEDTIIEAIDERSGELIASVRLDAAAAGFVSHQPIVFAKREDESGLILIDIFRLSIAWQSERHLFP